MKAVRNGHIERAIECDRHHGDGYAERSAAPAHSEHQRRWPKNVHQIGVPEVENPTNAKPHQREHGKGHTQPQHRADK